ncbi:MAG: AraC family transcriptional regulator [Ruminococcus sp.]|nr:AraC family transcriptional regulator [Ruminococcus sp.]
MRKRICVIMTGINYGINHKIIEGISNQANALKYDIYTYSFFNNPIMGELTQLGSENILNLIETDIFDGFISRKGSFHNEKIRERIGEICRNSGKPYIDLDDPDAPDEEFPLWNDRKNFYNLTEHLITVHNCRKIYCVTGYKGFHQSESRLAGYRDALLAYGIEPNDNYEFYGDYWKDYARRFADKLANSEISMPDAVAFAGTTPACSFIERLSQYGIRVPEDIVVVGYDCTLEGVLSTPAITSISHNNYNQGINVMCRLHKLITGYNPETVTTVKENIQTAESCGCNSCNNDDFRWYRQYLSAHLDYEDMFRNSAMQQNISSANNADEFFSRLIHFRYLIRGIHKICYCLCDDWDGINNIKDENYRSQGYSKNLLSYMHTEDDVVRKVVKRHDIYDYIQNKEQPSAYFFFPLHYKDKCFGFISLEFINRHFSPESLFINWIDLINNALELIRIRYYTNHFSQRINLAVIRDPLTGIYNRRGFEEISSEIYEYAVIHRENFLIIAIRLFNLHEINQICGHEDSDKLIITMAEAVSLNCIGNEIGCRVRTDMFYIVGSHNEKVFEKNIHEKKILEYCGKHLEDIEAKQHIKIDIEVYFEPADSSEPIQEIIDNLDTKLSLKHRNRQKRITHLSNMAELRRAIYKNPQFKWTIEEMADMMMLSRAYFQRMYKQNFGISAASDVIAARVKLAKKLLSAGKSIRETAEKCGYAGETYFMQQFKKETGITPSEFRKNNV